MKPASRRNDGRADRRQNRASAPNALPGAAGADIANVEGGGIEIEIPARTDYVSLVRLVVAEVAALESSLEPERIDDLRVAVSEAATNAVQAHIRSGCTHSVRVSCCCIDGAVSVRVDDEGPGFDADSLMKAAPPVENPARLGHESGMGLLLIRHLADEVIIDSSSAGTKLRLLFRTSRPSGSR
ncbi:MAG: ATP-binding protein [Acidimicrobiaceae bacterium]|nr:ATP-binding protein [Acidimicrobiaceae bacterium]MCY4280929.1 ATP-binding protein [Acidimicrobiaceae bacterium]